jgi:exodeoxyribonuclease VII small subunit
MKCLAFYSIVPLRILLSTGMLNLRGKRLCPTVTGVWIMAKPENSSPKENTQNEETESDSFEDSFHRLSEMAEQLEAGGLTLAEATSRFEEGMKLVQFCNQLLNNAELKITELKESYRSTDVLTGFDDLDDDPDDDLDE